mmetsp:Transcript_16679/g.30287  ORF Transcript_16679/g.30287 Transcript_16679/m.30287 type:complete len:210 (-) Transcript_16679:85-714(-)
MFIFRLEFLNGLGREDATFIIENLVLLLLPPSLSLFPAALFIFPRMEFPREEDAHDHGELMESSPTPGEGVAFFMGNFFVEWSESKRGPRRPCFCWCCCCCSTNSCCRNFSDRLSPPTAAGAAVNKCAAFPNLPPDAATLWLPAEVEDGSPSHDQPSALLSLSPRDAMIPPPPLLRRSGRDDVMGVLLFMPVPLPGAARRTLRIPIDIG